MSNRLIDALQQPGVFPHSVTQFEIIETHLSWIILTGLFAYKIKKAVNLGFQDFTTLEKRKYFCEKEVEFNQPLASSLYIGVIPITGTPSSPSFHLPGTPIEYAVKMRQFSQGNLLNHLTKENTLSIEMMDSLACQIAYFHQKAIHCDRSLPYGDPEQVLAPIKENFSVLKKLPAGQPYLSTITDIEAWSKTEGNYFQELMTKRKQTGWIRACHGDLHLGNIVMIDDKPLIFDCIEFNEPFRWIDVMNDLGFLIMDLDRLATSSLKNSVVNRYMELTQDFQGLALLHFYQCYRAMVRAKISAYQLQLDLLPDCIKALEHDLKQHFALASQYTLPRQPSLTIAYGVSGSGKTYAAQQRVMAEGSIRLRSDTTRLQLYPDLASRYSTSATQVVYQSLATQAETILRANYSVIVDAACLKREQRQLFWDLAKRLNIPFHILSLDAPLSVLEERICQRQALQNDPSEATLDILHQQLKNRDPLTETEKEFLIIGN